MALNKWSCKERRIHSKRWGLEENIKERIWKEEDIRLSHGNIFFLSVDDDMSGGMLALFTSEFVLLA